MPRKQRTAIKGSDPKYHSNLPRKSDQPSKTTPTAIAAKAQAAPKKIESDQGPKRHSKTEAPAPKPNATRKPKVKSHEPATPAQSGATREVHLTAAITRAHGAAIDDLAAKGIDRKVPIRLAGRKAVQLFDPKREFIEKPDADRLPIRDGYQTTKRINTDLIDHLRAENDPYGLSSDTAMLRGQFEPLFWKCLEEVLQELSRE
jgi:hypothetical protein|tara:strand:- start:5972 stop:6580 length:609 start_codon:yes stop_codon:yes gene_type:complete